MRILIFFLLLLITSCGSTSRVKQVVDLAPNTATEEEASVASDQKEMTEETVVEEVAQMESAAETKAVEDTMVKEMEQDTTKSMTKVAVDPMVETLPAPAAEATTFDHTIWNTLLQKHVNAKGDVDYSGFKKELTVLETYLSQLSDNMPTETWEKNEILAYWINAYNAFTVKLIIVNYPTNSIKDIKDPWGQRFFKLGKKWYNLTEIEHKILRKMDEPRIHFAINCASFSCPKLLNEAFTASQMEAQLEQMTIGFVNDPTRNKITANAVQLSQIFKWYKKDFTTTGKIIAYLNAYAKTPIDANAKISYLKYDWSLNEAK